MADHATESPTDRCTTERMNHEKTKDLRQNFLYHTMMIVRFIIH